VGELPTSLCQPKRRKKMNIDKALKRWLQLQHRRVIRELFLQDYYEKLVEPSNDNTKKK